MKLTQPISELELVELVKNIEPRSPLFMSRNPLDTKEIATKEYVDITYSNLDGSLLTIGTITPAIMPTYNGDVVKGAAPTQYTLVTVNSSGFTCFKPFVTEKGLVTGGSSISTSDINAVSWNSITTDKPTTLTGYGITDGILRTGGTSSGNIIYTISPTANNHPVTRQYVISRLNGIPANATGECVELSMVASSLPGYLRCNGATYLKLDYPDLHPILGSYYSLSSTTFRVPDLVMLETSSTSYWIKK